MKPTEYNFELFRRTPMENSQIQHNLLRRNQETEQCVCMVLLIPQFCPHRQRTGVQQRCRHDSDWPRGSTAVHVGSHLYRMCPYGPQTHNRRTRFSEII